jgi:phage gpG-like protein
MSEVIIKVTGTKEAMRTLRKYKMRAADVKPAWDKVEEHLALNMQRAFATHGASTGRAWKPLKPEYAAWKTAHGYPPTPLIRTGELWRSVSLVPMDISRKGLTKATFGTSVDYASYHMTGTRNMPARPFFRATRRLSGDISRILADYIEHGRVR